MPLRSDNRGSRQPARQLSVQSEHSDDDFVDAQEDITASPASATFSTTDSLYRLSSEFDRTSITTRNTSNATDNRSIKDVNQGIRHPASHVQRRESSTRGKQIINAASEATSISRNSHTHGFNAPHGSVESARNNAAERFEQGPEGDLRGQPQERSDDAAYRSDVMRQQGGSEGEACDQCERRNLDLAYCNVCEATYCPLCWNGLFLHTSRYKGPPHEKTHPAVARKVRDALNPPAGEGERERLYEKDEDTAWFGIERPDDNGPPVFQDHGRFADLMSQTDPTRVASGNTFTVDGMHIGKDTRTPSLVSFVGQTGAGKSTLVKLLIDFGLRENLTFQTPVVGLPGAHNPTSEDVHLYIDPRTANDTAPLLFVDCEGLQGGEREPLGAKFKRKRRAEKAKSSQDDSSSRAMRPSFNREIKWAHEVRARSREYAVTNLYPRLLCAFSDVIVFVLKNPRTIEMVFERLIEWAAAALETTSNQPLLPHAVIALNATDLKIHPMLWDVVCNTTNILDDLAQTVNRNATFKKWAQFWRERNKTIDTLEDLVLCYYSSIVIIRIPGDGNPTLMESQLRTLYETTFTACLAARRSRNSVRMLFPVDELQSYLQDAFTHYAESLELPFDFVQASFRNSPLPPNFGGNILKLALNVMNLCKEELTGPDIFAEISYMIASCIMLDSVRGKSKGNVDLIFPSYIKYLDDALESFCNQHWPCEFVDQSTGVRCVNARSGHSKGHQNSDGSIFAVGQYTSSFKFDYYQHTFRDQVFSCLRQLFTELTDRCSTGEQEETAAASLHLDKVVRSFYRRTSTLKSSPSSHMGRIWGSHTACLCCLVNFPEYVLPCGHVFCTPCVRMYGKTKDPSRLRLYACPIEPLQHQRQFSWEIVLKPTAAGARLLTLDGGGIRGIVELEILRQIELALGGKLPIRSFFDLVVGTSTGGLVALGIGQKGWDVTQCIDYFEHLCHQAFTRRFGGGIPLLGFLVENYHHSRYETTPLEEALREAFSDDEYLFGGARSPYSVIGAPKVAVTATSPAAKKTFVLANYNRLSSEGQSTQYQFQRPDSIKQELKVWEAARATSAAPKYFRPFYHSPSQRAYVDGALYHNNPIRIAEEERKILWPEHECADIILSLGTAYSTHLHRVESERMQVEQRGFVARGKDIKVMAKNFISTSIDCERAFNDFQKQQPETIKYSKFVRINPLLTGNVPELDAANKMSKLRNDVQGVLEHGREIQKVALQLVATTFYVQLLRPIIEMERGPSIAEGRICCRFPQRSREIQELGKFFKQKYVQGAALSFSIRDCEREIREVHRTNVTPDLLNLMITEGKFELRPLEIPISSKIAQTEAYLHFTATESYALSGFPRSLFMDERSSAGSSTAKPSAVSSSIYTQGSRRGRGHASWTPPTVNTEPPNGSLQQYADPSSDLLANATKKSNVLPVRLPDQSQHRPQSSKAATRGIKAAFRALVQPLRSRHVGNYGEYPGLEVTPVPGLEVIGSSTEHLDTYTMSANEKQIYSSWSKQLSASSSIRIPGAALGLEGSSSPVYEMDTSTQVYAELPAEVPIEYTTAAHLSPTSPRQQQPQQYQAYQPPSFNPGSWETY